MAIVLMAVAAPRHRALRAAEIRTSGAMTKPPSAQHYFGTDQIGRDTLSRVIHGSRASLTVAFCGRAARHHDSARCGAWRAASSAAASTSSASAPSSSCSPFPDLILAMAIAMALGAGTGTVIVAIAITRIPFGGRVIRSVVLSLKEMPYVEAARGARRLQHARSCSATSCRSAWRPILILATTHLGVAIIIEASLGFLGVGIPPPTPTWGNMLVGRPELGPGAAVVAGAVPRRSPSPSPCSPSTCSATASATCSIPAPAAERGAERRTPLEQPARALGVSRTPSAPPKLLKGVEGQATHLSADGLDEDNRSPVKLTREVAHSLSQLEARGRPASPWRPSPSV